MNELTVSLFLCVIQLISGIIGQQSQNIFGPDCACFDVSKKLDKNIQL